MLLVLAALASLLLLTIRQIGPAWLVLDFLTCALLARPGRVAALPRLRNVHLREVTAARLRNTFGRFPLGCCRRSHVGVVGPRAPNRFCKRKRRLRRRRRGPNHAHEQE